MAIAEYPQTASPKRAHRRAWTISAGLLITAAVILAGAIVLPPTISAANQAAYNTAQEKAQAAVPAAPIGDVTTTDEQQALADSDAAGAKAVSDEQAAEAAASALAAQQAAAAQAAYAAARAYHSNVGSDGLIHCPAGSMANSGDSSGATSCFPDICFHVTLPDPAYPQCVTAFKP